MLTYFLFLFYLVSGTLLAHVFIRRRILHFTFYHTASVILFKVFMGCLYGWVFMHYYGGDDTWNYFIESKPQTSLLLQHPATFFREFSPRFALESSNYEPLRALLFYIQDFERWFLIKGLAVLNLFSATNYYTNVLLFEFLTLPGQILLFTLMIREFPLRSGMNFLLIFFIPSFVFWCSGIRAEAFILLSIVLMTYNGYYYAQKPSASRLVAIIAGFLGLLLFRFQFLLVFLPAFAAFLISVKKNNLTPFYFYRIYLGVGLIFFASLFLPEGKQASRPIRHAQENFFRLNGNTRYALDTLKPGPVGFIKVLPQAFVNATLRPFPWEGKKVLQSFSSVDVIFIVFGLLFFLLGARRREAVRHPVYWIFLFYSLSLLISIGIVVPFPGAIVRYRSIPFLFLACFLYGGNPLLQQKLRYWIFKLH